MGRGGVSELEPSEKTNPVEWMETNIAAPPSSMRKPTNKFKDRIKSIGNRMKYNINEGKKVGCIVLDHPSFICVVG